MKQKLLNKLWLRVGMIVAIMTTALAGTAWAETVTFTSSTDKGSVTTNGITTTGDHVTKDGITITSSNGCMGSGQYRVYASGTLKIESSVGNISKIEFTFSGNYNNLSGTGYSNTTWQGTAASVVELSSSGQSRITEVTVTYTPTGSSAVETTTTINASGISNTDVYVNTAAGSLSASVTAGGNAVAGATVTWSSSDTDVATIASDGTVTLFSAGPVTFTASYAGVANTYQPSSATYEMTVTSSAPYVQPTTIEITPNYTFWGQTAQFSGSTYNNLSGSKDNISLAWSRGEGSTYANQNAMRFYKDNELTFTAPEGYEIKSIDLTVSGTYNDLTFSPSGYDNETTTWSGSSETVIMSRPSNASSYATINKFTITIGLPSTDPIINVTDPAELAYNATGGEFTYSITNPTSATLGATSNTDWITNVTVDGANSKVTFNTTANPNTTQRTGTITLTYTGATDKVVTITQAGAPVIYTTIPALFEAATSTATEVNITFGGWVVSAVHNNNAYLTDNLGHGLIIYANDHGFQANDVLTGTVSCKLQLYRGSAELTELTTSTTGLSVAHNGTVTEQNIAINELSGVNTGALVAYEGLTYNGTALVDGNSNTITPYTTLYEGTFENGKTYNVTGIYLQYNSTKEILPRSADDIVEVQVQHNEYALTVSDLENVEMFVFDAADDSNSLLDGEGTVQVYDGTEVMISVSAESGYQLASLMVNGVDVTSQIDETGAYTFTMPAQAVTVTATAVAVTPPTPASGKYVKVTSTNDLTDGQYLIVYEADNVAFNGGLETLDAVGNTIAVTISNNEIAATSTTTAAEFTIDVTAGTIKSASGQYIYASSYNNELKTSTSVPEKTNTFSFDSGDAVISVVVNETQSVTLRYNSASNQTRFRYYKSGQQAIQLYKFVADVATESVTVSSAGYATFASDNALDFTGSSIKAFYATESAGTLSFTQVNKVPADTGVLLYAEGGATVDVPVFTGEADAVTGNVFKRGEGASVSYTDNDQNYILFNGEDGIGFYRASNNNVATNRAYIHVTSSNPVKSFIIDLEDDATGISNLNVDLDANEAIYNLAGQRLQKMQKGINIVNGKKVLK